MTYLHDVLVTRVSAWRSDAYPSESYPAIAEILTYAIENDAGSQLRYLRKAQFRALETYWYIRLGLNTPTIPQLYEQLFPGLSERIKAMGISPTLFEKANYDYEALIQRIKTDNKFVRENHLESLRETLTLDYASYILALAMGAGKTILIGTIVATEFAMAQEYPDGPFVQNALVFAPGKTIIESLREIADIPFQRILPPRMHKPFAASLKLTFTRDGDKELSVVWGSSWNVVVTNTEKIRIQKNTVRRRSQQMDWLYKDSEHETDEANLRLQAIASLPHLAVFSDEAHHTYGQKLLGRWEENKETGELFFADDGIKKVRRTVDFLAAETNLVVVVNTTGTPYFERQPLRDVVIWYGLGEGIRDGVLKELANNIRIFDLDEGHSEDLVREIVSDFVDEYWGVRLHDGAPARLALYFPQTAAMDELRPAVESALALKGVDASTVLAVHSGSSEETRREFYRVAGDPTSPHRVILLVNMGTEGWNCPSLFACGLIRRLRSSNNFVLQAATRCLRQVPGNTQSARVYVSADNKQILARQLEETYGTTLHELNSQHTERVEKVIELHKPTLPPLLLKKRIVRFQRKASAENRAPLRFAVPEADHVPSARFETWTIAEPKEGRVRMTRVDGTEDVLELEPVQHSLYSAAVELAANYHLSTEEVLDALRLAYRDIGPVPEYHLEALGRQIEEQRKDYEQGFEEIDVALALVKASGFEVTQRNGINVYTARISFARDREHLYKIPAQFHDDAAARKFSFHYEGYNFDSEPEVEFLERALALVSRYADKVDGVWFTGGITDPDKTELYAEYLGDDGRWHRYTPDFVIRRKDGKHLVVEVKSDLYSADVHADLERHKNGQEPKTKEGRKAVALQRWQDLNPDVLHYKVVFANGTLHADALKAVQAFLA